jgi:hypothetical protein
MTSLANFHVPSEDEFKLKLHTFFSKHGYAVHEIPCENDKKRADFLLEDGKIRVLLELKIKGENPEESKSHNEVLDNGKIYEYEESSTRRNRLSALIKKGVSQLSETPEPADFRLLWLHGAGRYAKHHAKRFTATLYGSRRVVPVNKPFDVRHCYYFEDSDFFRHREILAGAIVSSGRDCQLCINDLYLHTATFRDSSFRQIFGQGYCDPIELEKADKAYIVDSNIDRCNKDEVRKYLATKYACSNFLDLDISLDRFSIRSDSPLITGARRLAID